MKIRSMTVTDRSRIAEIFVFNNRVFYYPIFHDETYSFRELQVETVICRFGDYIGAYRDTYVYDDGVVRGFITVHNGEVMKLYVDPFFQGRGIGGQLLEYALAEKRADRFWVLEKNERAIRFYQRHGFRSCGVKKPEDGTEEWLLCLTRSELV